MATIHKRLHSPNYHCSFKDATGVWRFRSTGTADRRAAQRICDGWQEAEELASGGELTRARILDLYNETLRRVGLQEVETYTIGDWLTHWLEGRKNISPSTRIAYEQAVREFLGYLGAGRNRKLETITERD